MEIKDFAIPVIFIVAIYAFIDSFLKDYGYKKLVYELQITLFWSVVLLVSVVAVFVLAFIFRMIYRFIRTIRYFFKEINLVENLIDCFIYLKNPVEKLIDKFRSISFYTSVPIAHIYYEEKPRKKRPKRNSGKRQKKMIPKKKQTCKKIINVIPKEEILSQDRYSDSEDDFFPKPKAQKKVIEYDVDYDNVFHRKRLMNDAQFRHLLLLRFKVVCFLNPFNNKRETFVIKPNLNEGDNHFLFIYLTYEFLKNKVDKIGLFETVKPDIVFTINNRTIALEIETGKVLKKDRKKFERKVENLKENYDDYIIIITDKNLKQKYKKYGKVFEKRYLKSKLLKYLKNLEKSPLKF